MRLDDRTSAIQRLNLARGKPSISGVEYRILAQRETDDRRQGFLGEVMWALVKTSASGVGYNFTDFSDNEFSRNDYSVARVVRPGPGRY